MNITQWKLQISYEVNPWVDTSCFRVQ